jgi:ribosomal 50S subunit-recycling heat shock protein
VRSRIIIDIRDGIDDKTALERVWQVVDNGKIRGDGKHYAYASLFKDGIVVQFDPNHKSVKFIVHKYERQRKKSRKDDRK